MNIMSRLHSKAGDFLARLLYTSLIVCGLGIASTPAQAAGTTVPVDSSPLIVQPSLPPNIVLMFDDSGSMDSDYMPDWGYLSDTSDDGVRNSSINGVYYNPAVTYTPPPKADGTLYPNSPSITGAYKDGFRDTSTTNVTKYTGTFPYYTKFTFASTSTYDAFLVCNYGDTLMTSGSYKGQCRHGTWNSYSYYSPSYACNYGDGNPNGSNVCTTTTYTYKYYFTYTTGSGNTKHYVGASGDCASLTSADQAVCADDATTRQNVANWFSYYRKRLLMAKSGLMSAFLDINPDYRIGFGSINGNNNDGLPSANAQYGSNNNVIAQVSPFGDGSSGTQKAQFWNWINDETANNSTPLRRSLDAVGQYYETNQPWTTMSSDPDPNYSGMLACRQSYTILTTDGFWNGGTPSSIGDQDDTNGPTVTGPNSQSYTYSAASPFADGISSTSTTTSNSKCSGSYSRVFDSGSNKYICKKSNGNTTKPSCNSGGVLSADQGTCSYTTTTGAAYSDTLADVAMKYWKNDLMSASNGSSDIANEVPPSNEDPAFWQHMATFTLGLGFTPKYADESTNIPMDQVAAWANGDATKAISNFTWPQPSSNSLNNIADLAHAAINGHGGFYSATSPQAFADGLREALKRASERVGTGASLAANSTQLQTGTVAYQANYYTSKWKGDLKALSIDSATGAFTGTSPWTGTAATMLPAAADRNIKTYNPTASAGSQFVDFKNSGTTPAALSTAQLAALGGSGAAQVDMINYLRGDSSLEQSNKGSFRSRDTALGDIIDSQPVYVGAPNPDQFYTQSFTGSSVFAAYASNNKNRAGLIYVAANDGMLHAFNAGTGVEDFAYLPGAVITAGSGNTNITALSNPNYGGSIDHQYFNDGELTVADVYVNSAWKTVLVGTTGRGLAKAVYALDVTNPASIQLLWERSAGDGLTNSNYIGQMTGKPVVAQTANGTWSVLMGNGYNSAAGKAAMLQFAITDGSLTVHDTTDTSGLAAPAVWISPTGNGVSTIAYAGDADGNVWSFALSASDGTPTPSSSGTKLYTAKDGSGNAQPITSGMLAGKDAQTGNTWVFFGTGKYLSASDLTDTSTQSWYGLIVQSANSTSPAVTATMNRTDNLAMREITGETSNARTVTTAGSASSMTNKSGWYIDLLSPTGANGADVNEGERMVTPNQFQGNLLLGTTRIPQAADACNPSGRGWILAVDPFTGTNPSGNFFDINGDGSVNGSDAVNGTPAAGIGFSSLPNNPIFVGSTMLTSFDNGTTSSIKTSSSTGGIKRVSWRELINQ
jgi:type IV pilus assembly protein PilY1